VRHVLLAAPARKQPRDLLATSLNDYISDLAWSRLGVEPREVSEITTDREIFRDLLGLLSGDSPQRKGGHENECKKET